MFTLLLDAKATDPLDARAFTTKTRFDVGDAENTVEENTTLLPLLTK
jgi:hypothetical protein